MTMRRRAKQTQRRTDKGVVENQDLRLARRNHQLNFPPKSIQLLCNLRDKMGKRKAKLAKGAKWKPQSLIAIETNSWAVLCELGRPKKKQKTKFPHYACRIINVLAPLGKTFEPLMACDAFYGFPMRTHMAEEGISWSSAFN